LCTKSEALPELCFIIKPFVLIYINHYYGITVTITYARSTFSLIRINWIKITQPNVTEEDKR
jgi:hypothetical protein